MVAPDRPCRRTRPSRSQRPGRTPSGTAGGVSQWLNSGVPAPEVAARAGHSVDVLLKVYAKCIDGQEQEMNGRIMRGMGEGYGTLP